MTPKTHFKASKEEVVDRFSNCFGKDLVEKALRVLSQIEYYDSSFWDFRPPLTSYNERREISFEWWSGNKEFKIFVTDQEIEYLRSWGSHINDMEYGTLSAENLRELLNWLDGPENVRPH